ncbi:hypothetical protein KBX06_22200 [Micromonospora sp. C31]|uniref:hypothetical protein n=1 Tax=Micromonospora sp. C31 TaxID=2824876 RepID=UPI001B374F61|nr:hypothetical protein [Micromonospora sp. C31]MBQ1075849.1 hypothetical protein [Micromonospora sp. C31]
MRPDEAGVERGYDVELHRTRGALALARPPARKGLPATPRLLLVPVPGTLAGLPADARRPVDGRAAVELLDLARVREEPAEVAAALTRHAGHRFVDALGGVPTDERPAGRRVP